MRHVVVNDEAADSAARFVNRTWGGRGGPATHQWQDGADESARRAIPFTRTSGRLPLSSGLHAAWYGRDRAWPLPRASVRRGRSRTPSGLGPIKMRVVVWRCQDRAEAAVVAFLSGRPPPPEAMREKGRRRIEQVLCPVRLTPMVPTSSDAARSGASQKVEPEPLPPVRRRPSFQ